jgi:hypothetical protein
MKYTDQDIRAASSPDMLALSAKFDEWFEAGSTHSKRVAFFEIAQLVYGISEVQFERAQGIRLAATPG